jgi:Response regulator containing a CheY-like receiver domain and an HTH DNA-binding domain
VIRILLAEDQTLVRDGLCALLAMRDGFEVVAVANGKEAVTAAREERFDIAVIDVRMPVMDGIECTRLLKEEHPGMPVLILTTFDDHSLVQKCLEAGASAYLLKDIHPDDLVNAIRLLLAGERLIPGDLARTLSETDDIPAEPLTPRQREVLSLIAQGLTNKEIAKQLYLSEGTVKNIVSEIYARLNVRDRVQAVLKSLGEI